MNQIYFFEKYLFVGNAFLNLLFNIKTTVLSLLFLVSINYAQIPPYYQNINFSEGSSTVFDDLSNLLTSTHTGVSYSVIWEVLQQADLDPEDETLATVLLIYGFEDEDGDFQTDRSRDKNLNCNFSGNCSGYWNREHVFPQSLANPPMTTNAIGTGTDAHNLRACDVQANSQRGNNKFATGSGDPFYGGVDNFYPGDEWRGDVARIILYMYLRYQEECLPLSVGSGSTTFNENIPDIFLEWNVLDAVSNFELQRNEVIYQIQGNRNPFIDNPYLATLLWGGPTAQNLWPLDGSDIVFDQNFIPINQIEYSNYTTEATLTESNAFELGKFIGRDGGESGTLDGLQTRLTELGFFIEGYENINKAALFVDGSNIAETTVVSQQINFTDFLVEIPDGATKTFSLYVSFEETVTDNSQIVFNVVQAATQTPSTSFAYFNAGGASTPSEPGIHKIDVVASQLEFLQEPVNVDLQTLMQPFPQVVALDANGNRDLDFTETLELTSTSTFANNAVTSIQAQTGLGIFDQLYFDLNGAGFVLTVTSPSSVLPQKQSNPFQVFDAPIVMTPNKVFITEVSDNPTFTLEYLEIFNNSERQITLTGSKLVMQPEGTVWGFGALSGNAIPTATIPPRGFAIVSRGANLQEFENYYGVLNNNTVFIQGTSAMLFAANSPREWQLYQGGTVATANGQLIDHTISYGVTNNERIYKNLLENSFEYSHSNMANPGELDDLVYVAGAWVNDGAPGANNENQNIYFFDDFSLSQSIIAKKSGIAAPYILNLNGFDLQVSEYFTFKSNASGTSQLDEIQGVATISGQVKIERYIPARRAFRLLSSAVSTTGNINTNWQEGQNNPNTSTNSNTVPGYGTHITGSMTGENGFDATPTGNPSLFTLNNVAQQWESVPNTDVNTIPAGMPYRLMVRGDRSIDVTDNNTPATNTTLRTTGVLHTGTFTTTNFSTTAGASNFFGNPYPAVVDMNDVISGSNNVNTLHYYVWDPTMNTRGGYVTVELPAGSNSSGSSANEYLQPGQAAFVQTLNTGASGLTFEENHKAVTQPQTQVFNVESQLDIRLYSSSSFATGALASDGLRIKFNEVYSNAVDNQDAPKFYNLDENLATNNEGSLLSIERRSLPEEGARIALFTNAYRTTDYVFEAILTEVNEITALLRDHYTGTDTVLANNENTLYAFSIDPDDAASSATDRFEIVFEAGVLSAIDFDRSNMVLFPNPAGDFVNLATKSMEGQQVTLSLFNMLGQSVYTKRDRIGEDGLIHINTSDLPIGVYLLKLLNEKGNHFNTKFIKQ